MRDEKPGRNSKCKLSIIEPQESEFQKASRKLRQLDCGSKSDLNFESMQDSNLSIFSAKELQSGPQRKTLEFINYKSDIQLGICAFFPLRAENHRLPHRFFSSRHDLPNKSKKMVFLFLIKRCLALYVQLWGLYPLHGRR